MKKQKAASRKPRLEPDPLADDEDELLDRFAALERQVGAPKKPSTDPSPTDDAERELLERLARLEKGIK